MSLGSVRLILFHIHNIIKTKPCFQKGPWEKFDHRTHSAVNNWNHRGYHPFRYKCNFHSWPSSWTTSTITHGLAWHVRPSVVCPSATYPLSHSLKAPITANIWCKHYILSSARLFFLRTPVLSNDFCIITRCASLPHSTIHQLVTVNQRLTTNQNRSDQNGEWRDRRPAWSWNVHTD